MNYYFHSGNLITITMSAIAMTKSVEAFAMWRHISLAQTLHTTRANWNSSSDPNFSHIHSISTSYCYTTRTLCVHWTCCCSNSIRYDQSVGYISITLLAFVQNGNKQMFACMCVCAFACVQGQSDWIRTKARVFGTCKYIHAAYARACVVCEGNKNMMGIGLQCALIRSDLGQLNPLSHGLCDSHDKRAVLGRQKQSDTAKQTEQEVQFGTRKYCCSYAKYRFVDKDMSSTPIMKIAAGKTYFEYPKPNQQVGNIIDLPLSMVCSNNVDANTASSKNTSNPQFDDMLALLMCAAPLCNCCCMYGDGYAQPNANMFAQCRKTITNTSSTMVEVTEKLSTWK